MSLRAWLLERLQRRSVIGPNTPGTPADWMVRMFGGLPATSGAQVNESTALSWTALMCGVRFLSETLASLPLRVYRHKDPRGKELLSNHPIARLVRTPNPEQSWFECVELMMTHAVLWGNGYAQIIWNGFGEPVELWPLNPDRVQLRRDSQGLLYYQVALPRDEIGYGGGQFISLPPDDILHIRGPSRWGLLGERIAVVHREAIGLGLATEEFAARFIGSGMHAGGILEHPAKLSADAQERLRRSVDRQAGGLSAAHRTLILEEGMKWQATTVEPDKAQFLGVRAFQLGEAARILRIPPHLLYDLSRATFTNIEHQSIDVVVFTLLPWARRWEARLDKQLISDKMQRSTYTKFALEGLLRGDTQTRYAAYATARSSGWLSVNDIRELEDMNPVDGGDNYLQPLNMGTLGALPAAPPALPPVAGDAADLGDGTGDAGGNGARALVAAMLERLGRGETRSDVNVTLPAPPPQQITIQNLLPSADPPVIEVRNEITVQPSPAPNVTVTPQAPVVRVAAPAVTVEPHITVAAELPRATRIEIERDAVGNVLAVTQK